MKNKFKLKENPELVKLGKEAAKSSSYVVWFPTKKYLRDKKIDQILDEN